MRQRELVLDRGCARDDYTAPQLVDERDEEQRERARRQPGSNALGEGHVCTVPRKWAKGKGARAARPHRVAYDLSAMDPEALRRKYAQAVCAAAGVRSPALALAFARVPRERFVGPGPWQIAQPFDATNPYRTTSDGALEHIYDDVLVAIDPARLLNNGQPSGHARWIDAVAPRPGESVLHIGCGVGYYSAVFAELVGPSGRVVAFEVDPDLATRAQERLTPWPNVHVVAADASEPRGPHDVIYVNAGATHARSAWLSSLAPGGRLLLPLTVRLPAFPHGVGFVIRAEKAGERWPAAVVSPVGIFDCAGAREGSGEEQLRKLLMTGAADRIGVLSIEPHARVETCLVHVEGFCLQPAHAP
jgi:protein-L-isoaspartate(D-aspartate) O-methyltransferase